MYTVVEAHQGYPTGRNPVSFSRYDHAVDFANNLADELEEIGWECDRSWASRDNYLCIRCTRGTGVHVIEIITKQ